MDYDIRQAFDDITTKFDSLDVEMQNTHGSIKTLQNDISEIKNQLLQNCAKLDKIIKHLGLN